MKIIKAEINDTKTAAQLAMRLWNGHSAHELEAELHSMILEEDSAVYIAYEDGMPVGFAQCSLRRDYVEGTSTSPVGYLEGIFVDENYRRRGIASSLFDACNDFAREKGCSEFASDCELDNELSREFHIRMGFCEANRIICFTKSI